ncbi:YtxH domain-containing protein [Jiulongibacter sediminis]|nr:YtxH domain-containing protein [Jiulongibacter sediminis]
MNKSIYLMAGVAGFMAGVLFAPAKGRVSRLRLKRNANRLANQAINELNAIESQIKEASVE